MKSWNVISGGPSRIYVRQTDLIPGAPTVSVNRGIEVLDKGVTVEFAMFSDPPKHLIENLGIDRYLVPPIQVWCPRARIVHENDTLLLLDLVSLWEPYLGSSVGIRTTPTGTVEGDRPGMQRHTFSLLNALERVMMFRPERVRILCAEMMGSWIPGKSESECEEHQSVLNQARTEIGRYQRRIAESKGKDAFAVVMRDAAEVRHQHLLKLGDPIHFKRWEHERRHLKALEERAKAVGCEFEWRMPQGAVTA